MLLPKRARISRSIWAQCYKIIHAGNLQNIGNKLECLFLAGLSNIVWCLFVKTGAYLRVEHIRLLAMPTKLRLVWRAQTHYLGLIFVIYEHKKIFNIGSWWRLSEKRSWKLIREMRLKKMQYHVVQFSLYQCQQWDSNPLTYGNRSSVVPLCWLIISLAQENAIPNDGEGSFQLVSNLVCENELF